ncbi:MAG: choice-of-anchor tandem repeat GloVer-containing protein, partial [Bryobacteraceae bacterium]
MERIVNALGKLASGKGLIYAVSALCATDAFVLSAQTFTVLENVGSRAGLVQATNGDLYGTIYGPGPLPGSVFKITPSGALTALYDFCSQSGCTDGKAPAAGLVQAANGDLYGTTSFGGANTNSANPDGAGTIFKITPSGTLTTLYSFCSQANCADGENPYTGLVQATNGDLYGTVYSGGTMGGGTIFKITPSGALTTLYNFCSKSGCVDGDLPLAGLVQAANGDFYGTTGYGGVANSSCQYGTCGTVFKITPGGALTTLYSFCSQSGCADGSNPYAGLVQATNGDLYGTTAYGGANCAPSGCGTVFKISPSGTLATLYSFCSESNCADGEIPLAGLVQAANRDLYGVTDYGGANGEGGT